MPSFQRFRDAMTTREAVNKRMRRRLLVLLLSPLAGVAVMAAGFFVASCFDGANCEAAVGVVSVGVAIVLGVGVLLGAFALATQRWRCPNCQAAMLRYFPPAGLYQDMFQMPRTFRYCPICGHCFDDERTAKDADGAV